MSSVLLDSLLGEEVPVCEFEKWLLSGGEEKASFQRVGALIRPE